MIVDAAVVLVFVPLPFPVLASFVETLGFVVSRCLFATGFLLSHQYHDGFVCIPMISYVYNIQYIHIPIYSWLILYGSIWLYLVAMFFKATPILRPGSSSERLPALRWQVWSFKGIPWGIKFKQRCPRFQAKTSGPYFSGRSCSCPRSLGDRHGTWFRCWALDVMFEKVQRLTGHRGSSVERDSTPLSVSI